MNSYDYMNRRRFTVKITEIDRNDKNIILYINSNEQLTALLEILGDNCERYEVSIKSWLKGEEK